MWWLGVRKPLTFIASLFTSWPCVFLDLLVLLAAQAIIDL